MLHNRLDKCRAWPSPNTRDTCQVDVWSELIQSASYLGQAFAILLQAVDNGKQHKLMKRRRHANAKFLNGMADTLNQFQTVNNFLSNAIYHKTNVKSILSAGESATISSYCTLSHNTNSLVASFVSLCKTEVLRWWPKYHLANTYLDLGRVKTQNSFSNAVVPAYKPTSGPDDFVLI